MTAPGPRGGGPATVVLLNGASSAGKSSTARALQGIARRPLFHVGMDNFLGMMPVASRVDPAGLVFEPVHAAGEPPMLAMRLGPLADRALRAMRRAVAAMADDGLDLIVDEVLDGTEGEADYRRLLARHRLLLVGLDAPVSLLEAREAARGDRLPGQARWQAARVHAGRAYDLMVDAALPADARAQAIRDAFDL